MSFIQANPEGAVGILKWSYASLNELLLRRIFNAGKNSTCNNNVDVRITKRTLLVVSLIVLIPDTYCTWATFSKA